MPRHIFAIVLIVDRVSIPLEIGNVAEAHPGLFGGSCA